MSASAARRPSPRLALTLCALALASGCRDSSPRARPAAGSSSTALDWPEAEALRLEAPPARIVPSSARSIEFLAALVGPERVAALPEQVFEYATLSDQEASFAALPRFQAYAAEPLLALRPDLVLGDPWQAAETHQRLREAGVRVLVLPETDSWRSSAELLLALGRVLGREERAREVVADLETRVSALERSGAARAGLRAAGYSNFGSQGASAGAGTTLDEMIRLAGMLNAVAETGRTGHGPLSFEELMLLDPDVIVVSRPLSIPAGSSGDRGGASEAILRAEPSLAGLRAVREGRIVSLPPGLYACASHLIVAGAEALAGEVDFLLARLAASPRAEGR